MARGAAARPVECRALLLRRTAYRESDLILSLFTETRGRVSALARGARKSQRRFVGALEPFHTLYVGFDEREGSELVSLTAARVEVARHHLVASLDDMNAAGTALRWLLRAAPARVPEPEAWRLTLALLDALDRPAHEASAPALLAAHGLALLAVLGWGLDFERCVGCGKPCPDEQTAMVDATRGGLVCRSCGGARLRLPAERRQRLRTAAQGGLLSAEDASIALELVDRALEAHGGITDV